MLMITIYNLFCAAHPTPESGCHRIWSVGTLVIGQPSRKLFLLEHFEKKRVILDIWHFKYRYYYQVFATWCVVGDSNEESAASWGL